MNSLYIAFNLFKRVFSGWKGWFSNLVMPVTVISLIVAFVGGDTTVPLKVGYAVQDQGALGDRLVEQIAREEGYQLEAISEQELKDRIISGDLSVGFTVPSNFTEKLLAGEVVPIQYYYLSVTEDSFALEFAIDQAARQMERTVRMAETASSDGKEQQILSAAEQTLIQQAKNQVKATVTDAGLNMNGSLYLVIGFMLFFVMGLILNSLGYVLEDRNQMTMSRIYTAPVRSFEIALGNFLGSFGLGALQILAVLVITYYGLGYRYGIGFLPLFTILAFFLLAAVGIGSAVAGLVKSSSNIGSLNALIITPTCMVGGCWWPLSVMPDFMQKIANFVPQKWAIDAVESMATGANFTQIALHLGILTLIAVIFLSFGAVVLRPNEHAS